MEETMTLDRPYILNEFLRNIYHISDRTYQERVWIKGLGPECDSFDEAVCYFFGTGDPILEEHEEFGLTEEQYEILKRFRDKFNSFIDTSNHYFFPLFFIDTPEWAEIMQMAKEVLKAFQYNPPKTPGITYS